MAKKKSVATPEHKAVATALDYQRTFGSEEGERVLWDLMKFCHVTSVSYNGKEADTIFHEGERNVCLMILNQMNTDVNKLREFIKKRQQEKESTYA